MITDQPIGTIDYLQNSDMLNDRFWALLRDKNDHPED